MIVSGGRIGSQIELTPGGPCKAQQNAVFAEIIKLDPQVGKCYYFGW